MKAFCTGLFIVLGVIPTILLFATHNFMCEYDMNPLCYIECVLPLIITFPCLFAEDDWS